MANKKMSWKILGIIGAIIGCIFCLSFLLFRAHQRLLNLEERYETLQKNMYILNMDREQRYSLETHAQYLVQRYAVPIEQLFLQDEGEKIEVFFRVSYPDRDEIVKVIPTLDETNLFFSQPFNVPPRFRRANAYLDETSSVISIHMFDMKNDEEFVVHFNKDTGEVMEDVL